MHLLINLYTFAIKKLSNEDLQKTDSWMIKFVVPILEKLLGYLEPLNCKDSTT
jgi:hypothetical protein